MLKQQFLSLLNNGRHKSCYIPGDKSGGRATANPGGGFISSKNAEFFSYNTPDTDNKWRISMRYRCNVLHSDYRLEYCVRTSFSWSFSSLLQHISVIHTTYRWS